MAATSKTKAPEQTFQESRYLKHLAENHIPVRVRLTDNSEVKGTIEFYDVSFIRLTRVGEPNLFLYKHDIKYLYEVPDASDTPATEAGGSVTETKDKAPPRPVR